MARKIHFTKMHGCGNDYIYVNTIEDDVQNPEALSVAWSDRHCGIGSDGLVLIGASPVADADFSMRIFNADGSEAMMCGNASRCVGKYLYDRGLTNKTEIRLYTASGIKILSLKLDEEQKVSEVTVDMLEPCFSLPSQFNPESGLDLGVFVSMGNPHYVVFVDDVDVVAEKGVELENHKAFPQRCNIEFARVEKNGTIRTRVWERGSGITMACGTGACATAVAAALTGRSGRKSRILMDGGSLLIEWSEKDNHVYMTGSASFVYDGIINFEK